MRYLILIHTDEAAEAATPPDQMAEVIEQYHRFTQAMAEAGVLRDGIRLRPTTSATTVRIRNGDVTTTDGPFAETKEQFGGLYLIDVPTLDDAIQWASRCPSAAYGSIEVRPVWEMED